MSNVQSWRELLDRGQLVVVVVALGMLACFVLLVCVPDAQALGRAQAALDEGRQGLEEKTAKIKELPSVAAQVAAMKSEYQEHVGRVPTAPRVPQFLGEVADMLKGEGVVQSELVPQRLRNKPTHTELPIKISFEGAFGTVFRLLARLEQLDRVNRVESLALGVLPRAKAGRLQVDMQVVIYHSNAAAPGETAGGAEMEKAQRK